MKIPGWLWIIIIILVVGWIGSPSEENTIDVENPEDGDREWVAVQTIEFNTDDTYFGSIIEEDYDTVTLPEDATRWGVVIEWRGGDKDSYVRLTMWEYGEVDDTNLGQLYENAKQGEESWEKPCDGGETVYVEASAINECHGTILVGAYVPK